MLTELLNSNTPYDPTLAKALVVEVNFLAAATERNEDGLSLLPMELDIGAEYIENVVDYFMTGTDVIMLEEYMNQVSPFPCVCGCTVDSL